MAARILVINDTQEILELFRILLEEEGYEVILSGFPIQQISDFELIKPDLIILDLVFWRSKERVADITNAQNATIIGVYPRHSMYSRA